MRSSRLRSKCHAPAPAEPTNNNQKVVIPYQPRHRNALLRKARSAHPSSPCASNGRTCSSSSLPSACQTWLLVPLVRLLARLLAREEAAC